MFINKDEVIDIVTNDDQMLKLFHTDNNFNTSINMLMRNELSTKQIIGLIFMLCDGHKNTTDELIKYISRFGILI